MEGGLGRWGHQLGFHKATQKIIGIVMMIVWHMQLDYCWNIKITNRMWCIFLQALSNNLKNILFPLPLRFRIRIVIHWGKFYLGRLEVILFLNFWLFRMKLYLSRCLQVDLRVNWTRGGRLWQPELLKLWSWQIRSNLRFLSQGKVELWVRWLQKVSVPNTEPWR